MPKPTSSYRIPKYLHEFIREYKRAKKIENSTDVVIYALDTLKKSFDEEKGEGIEFVSHNVNNDILTPKERVLHKIENDNQFRKEEYKIVHLLTEEQLKDYTENYQELGMTLQAFYKAYIKK